MTQPTGTKTKRVKIDSLYPPVDVRDNTKARREWLAAAVRAAVAVPGQDARIVGQGSYQSVSVYRTTEVHGRLRNRGHCQYCGNTQVVQDGKLVLHGYQRPGWGTLINECPGAHHAPLEFEKVLTENWLLEATERHEMWERSAERATKAVKVAQHALYDLPVPRVEEDARRTYPRKPSSTVPVNDERYTAYKFALAAWKAANPLTAALFDAELDERTSKHQAWVFRRQVEHFTYLLHSNVHGMPLLEEVVA